MKSGGLRSYPLLHLTIADNIDILDNMVQSMSKLSAAIFASALCVVSVSAESATFSGRLLFGMAMPKSQDSVPVLIDTWLSPNEECFMGGTGTLVAERLEIMPQTMSCGDKSFAYEYDLKDVTVSDNTGATGIQTKHVPPSKDVMAVTAGMKEVYRKTGSEAGLRYVSNVEAGTWHVEPGTNVQIHFATEPVLSKRVSLKQ